MSERKDASIARPRRPLTEQQKRFVEEAPRRREDRFKRWMDNPRVRALLHRKPAALGE